MASTPPHRRPATARPNHQYLRSPSDSSSAGSLSPLRSGDIVKAGAGSGSRSAVSTPLKASKGKRKEDDGDFRILRSGDNVKAGAGSGSLSAVDDGGSLILRSREVKTRTAVSTPLKIKSPSFKLKGMNAASSKGKGKAEDDGNSLIKRLRFNANKEVYKKILKSLKTQEFDQGKIETELMESFGYTGPTSQSSVRLKTWCPESYRQVLFEDPGPSQIGIRSGYTADRKKKLLVAAFSRGFPYEIVDED